jgi:hypothetical protein
MVRSWVNRVIGYDRVRIGHIDYRPKPEIGEVGKLDRDGVKQFVVRV